MLARWFRPGTAILGEFNLRVADGATAVRSAWTHHMWQPPFSDDTSAEGETRFARNPRAGFLIGTAMLGLVAAYDFRIDRKRALWNRLYSSLLERSHQGGRQCPAMLPGQRLGSLTLGSWWSLQEHSPRSKSFPTVTGGEADEIGLMHVTWF